MTFVARAVIPVALLLSGAWGAAHAPMVVAQAQSAPAPPLEVSGATYSEFDAQRSVWTLRGSPVVVTRAAFRLEAGQIIYEEKTGAATATERVVVTHETVELRAPRVDVRLPDRYVDAQGGVLVTDRREDGDTTLQAARVEAWLNERRLRATGSPADLGLPQGRLTASRIDADLAGETAEARGNVTLSGRGVVGTSPVGRVDRRKGIAVLSGGATVRRGEDVLTAATITIDLRTERMVATGSPRLTIAPRPSP